MSTTALLNVDVPDTDVTAFKSCLIRHHLIPVASSERKAHRKGYVSLVISVQGYWHTRMTEALHESSATIVAVLLPNGERYTLGKATLLRKVANHECAIFDLWGQPV